MAKTTFINNNTFSANAKPIAQVFPLASIDESSLLPYSILDLNFASVLFIECC